MAVTSPATAARNRRRQHEQRIDAETSPTKKFWQVMAWLAAEAKEFPPDEAQVPLALVTDLAVEMNAMNAERRRR